MKSIQKAEPFYSHNFTSHKAEITFYKFIRSAKVRFHIPNFEGSRSLWEKADLFHFLGLENQTLLGNTKNQTSLIQSFKTILKLSKSDIWLRNYIDFPI